MDMQLGEHLNQIEIAYGDNIQRGSRHYLEVNLAEQARKRGDASLGDKHNNANAIIPLKQPHKGMKVRIDGRTFVNYAKYDSGMVVPRYLAQASKRNYRDFVPNDSMICNLC